MSDDALNRIDEKIEKLDSKIDIIVVTLGAMKEIQARHDENLKDHMKRSDTLEARTDVLFDQLEPVKKHINMVEGGIRFIGIITAVISFVLGTLKILGKI